MQRKEFLHYIHYSRGLAILFIVGLHACVTLLWGEGLLQRKALVVLFNNGTVLFVFISGFLFYHLSKDRFDYIDFLKKKFQYVILPYLFVSVPAILDKFYLDKIGEHWWMDQGFNDSPLFFKVFFLLLSGRHMGVFWFIPMITIIYLITPLILAFSKTKVFLFVTPIIALIGLFTFRFGYYANIALSLEYFFPVYIFGIWVYRIKDFLFSNALVWVVALGAIYLGLSLAEFFEWIDFNETIGLRDVQYTVYRFNFNKFKMQIFSVFILVTFYMLGDVKLPLLKLLGNYSFGIFFVHLYVIQIFRLADQAAIVKISPPNVFTFAIYFAAVVFITVAIVTSIKFVFKNNSRYFIGS